MIIRICLGCSLLLLLAARGRAAEAFDPMEFWREPADLPLDVVVLEKGEDAELLWQSMVYTSETYNGEPMRIFAWYARPKGNGKYAGVLSIHGGGGGADLPRAKEFAKAGYPCLAFDWNTFGDPEQPKWRPGDPLPAYPFTWYGNLRYPDWARQFSAPEGNDWKRPVLYRAIMAARRGLTWLGQQPEIDRGKLVIEGHSWGGFLAQLLAGIDPRVKAAVSSAAILGWRSRYEAKPPEGHTASLTPEQFSKWEKRYDAAMYARSIKCPILIRCGVADFFGSIDTLPAYWDKIRAPKSLQLIAAGNHTFADVETRAAWFARWLKGGPAFPEITGVKLVEPGNDGYWTVAATAKGPAEIQEAAVAWTTGAAPLSMQRAWAQRFLQKKGDGWTGKLRPVGTGAPLRVYVSVKDANGCIVSSLPIIRQMPKPFLVPAVVTEADVQVARAARAPSEGETDWAKAPAIKPISQGPEVLGEQDAALQALWDAEALHIRLIVNDTTPWFAAAPGALWHSGDSIQLRLRTDEKVDGDPGLQQHVLHLGWYPDPKVGHTPRIDAVRGKDFKGKVDDVSLLTAKLIKTESLLPSDGSTPYTLVARIPWSFIDPAFKPEEGKSFRFALQVNYGDLLTDERVGVIDFNHAGEFGNPDAWGKATLIGEKKSD